MSEGDPERVRAPMPCEDCPTQKDLFVLLGNRDADMRVLSAEASRLRRRAAEADEVALELDRRAAPTTAGGNELSLVGRMRVLLAMPE